MNAYYLKPADKVSEYVQEILVIENHWVAVPFVLPLFANGTPTLLFQTAKGRIKNSSNYLTLFGQTIFPDRLIINDNFTLVAYFLKPHALVSLFGISAQELTNNPIDLNLLSHCKTANIQEQLLNATSTTQMLALLNDYLFNLSTKIKVATPLVKYATNKIVQNPHYKILREMQNELCITERTFQRMFERDIGTSPNQYRRICQFNNAFQQLNRKRTKNLTEITFQNGYADQSHFIRTFREFTNLTPTEYLNYGTRT
ncbi:helix-turn-helix domain-containing protein [Pedobacter arcticus]|uniref:helix-turn-helix domain-containing protein n=1 Tax=Pedobacter arcticus TaxID=752140 RepID=UPI000316A9B4|nr:helix-turn-helix domain-containing protein [Pedobacter arcticus]